MQLPVPSRPLALVSILLAPLASGCDPDGPRAELPPEEAGVIAGDPFRPALPRGCTPSRPSPPAPGFAVHGSGAIVAFEPTTGRELLRHALGAEVLDLEWDPRTRRLLVASAERFDLEGSRVHALGFDGEGLVHEASSEVFPGEVRVIASAARVIVVGGELAAEWYELDDDLAVAGASGALPRPELVVDGDGTSLIALRREPAADIVARVSGSSPGWVSTEFELPRLDPEQAVGIAGGSGELWLLRQGATSLELAALELTRFPPSPPPELRAISGHCRAGPPRALGWDGAGCALVAAGGPDAREIVLAPTSVTAESSCFSLPVPLARAERWIARNLALDPAARLGWVATERGLVAFTLDPPVRELGGFEASELGPPIALAR
jgi:hypothetical protein